MKVIQICGTNGTGKTTLVKGLLASGNFLRMALPIDGEVKEWWFDGEVAVIGKYASNNCCGVDASNYSGDLLIKVVDNIIASYVPKAVVFEDMRFGCSYSFKQKAKQCTEKRGGEYIAFVLMAELNKISTRVIGRSGNPNVNFDRMRQKQRQCINSARKIGNDGSKVYFINTECKSKMELLSALKGVINAEPR